MGRWMAWTLLLLAGCGGRATYTPPTEPLTVEQWKQMPPEKKFEIETFERLKQGEPKLQDQRAWDQFARTVVNPAKKREFVKTSPPK